MQRFPCPCCGYRTLPAGPGDYELCPVCFWEDDGGQLRSPTSPQGPNGISLVEAQQIYQRVGASDDAYRKKVRRPKPDEPLDEGWRPFAPGQDWEPAPDDERWPANAEALYYWRPTYWRGDQHRTPLPPQEPTNADRLLEHLREQVPELHEAIAASERRFGRAHAFEVCAAASDLVLAAYRRGDSQLPLRVVTALTPALDEDSDLYTPNCVCIAFLENEGWDDPAVAPHIDDWPAPVRDELQTQQAHLTRNLMAAEHRQETLEELFRTGRGLPVPSLVERLRVLEDRSYDHPELTLSRELMARLISDPRWLLRHPVDSARLAWRFRTTWPPQRTIGWLVRPRYAG